MRSAPTVRDLRGFWLGLNRSDSRAVGGQERSDRPQRVENSNRELLPPLHFRALDGPSLIIRGLLWLTPCPEAEIMRLDWARIYPRAGGLSSLLSVIMERALVGDFATA
ncbi:unnamed protein product [Choristocarpus tenellus]